MKKGLLAWMVAVVMGGLMLAAPMTLVEPAWAANKGDPCTCADGSSGTVTVDTAILSGCDCGKKGGATVEVLNLVVSIMTIGIGVLGVVGITIVGIQYLTAGGNEEKTRKAKRRMFEIVIGLVAYVLIYALLRFLLPGFKGV